MWRTVYKMIETYKINQKEINGANDHTHIVFNYGKIRYLLCDFEWNHLKTALQIGVCSGVSLSREKVHLFPWQISNLETKLELILHMGT